MNTPSSPALAWHILRRYDRDHLGRIALPVGGIATGTVALSGRGGLRDFEWANRPAKHYRPHNTHLLLWSKAQGYGAVTRLLEGPLPAPAYEGWEGTSVPNAGLPRFSHAAFEATYPFGRALLSDPDVPLLAMVEAWNPLSPPDMDRSGLPVMVLRVHLTNPTAAPVDASVAFSLGNAIGDDGVNSLAKAGRITARDVGGVSGLLYETDGVPTNAETWGTVALTTTATEGVSHRTAWARRSWGDSLLDFWDDFSADGRVDARESDGEDRPTGTLAVRVVVPPGETTAVEFLLTWHFPNRMSWTPDGRGEWLPGGGNRTGPPIVGNHYTTRFADAWHVAESVQNELVALETETVAFVNAFCASDMPDEIKEAALFNLSALRTQTVFRTPDGNVFGWEGTHDKHGSCFGSCTHVWNYEQATAFLFAPMARSFRETEFLHMTDRATGHMAFRVGLPLEKHARCWELAAADGQMGCLLKLYRDWKLSGNDDWLRSLWEQAKSALRFAWIPGGWDGDRDGVMEGCQHNTMDVEYYGANGQMAFWYLGALRAMEEMARHLGEARFADECRALFESGSRSLDADLFNGEFYIQHVAVPGGAVAGGLGHDPGKFVNGEPPHQLGNACLVDQTVGQFLAHVCGLGYLAEPGNVNAALSAVMRYNRRADLTGHFNHMRSFALGGESAILMATYPHGDRPTRPFPYFNEVMTGFEYTVAAHLLYEGRDDEGLGVVRAIRERYDGAKRSPFDEAECGHHYARAMASWACVLAWSGQTYDAHTGSLRFKPLADGESTRHDFWATGDAWGTAESCPGGEVLLSVGNGTVQIGDRLLRAGDTEIIPPGTEPVLQ